MPTRKRNSKSKEQCLALEDEETRCIQPPTHGSPPERCETHDGQYRNMTKKYKDASKIVDEMQMGSNIPTKAEILRYTDFHSTLQKARWMRKYVEAIRVEKNGREIHHRRFFLKIDDGHKIRVKLLAKKMVSAVEILDAIQARAFDLHIAKHPAKEWVKEFQANRALDTKDPMPLAEEAIARPLKNLTVATQRQPSGGSGHHDDDLIDMKIRAEKANLLYVFKPLLEHESWLGLIPAEHVQRPGTDRMATIGHNVALQYARRILFNDPVLSLKAVGKVSFKDLLLDDDFSFEDVVNFVRMWEMRMGFGLVWWKDSTLEALAMLLSNGEHSNAANVGDPKDRFPMVGGWIFNRPHKRTMSNEAWWHFIQSLNPPANVENRFMRACNNFDDLHTFLSFGAFGYIDPPSSCVASDDQGEDSQASRKHLSLCGIAVADMVSAMPPIIGPLPTPTKRRGYLTWAEFETRSYMFGAIRNEPDQLTEAFLAELRARPDLFLVLTRSDTDPGRKVETFGGPDNEPLAQVRTRTFEAPFPLGSGPHGPANWVNFRSAIDILYARKPIEGYMIAADRPGSGAYFRFKKFPVKYFVILDATPSRHVRHLSRLVAWAALRARKLIEGEYDEKVYCKASDVLFQSCASERLDWMPKIYGNYKVTNLMGE